MIDTSHPESGRRNRLRWIARIWLSASAVSGLVVHYYFHDPVVDVFHDLDPAMGQALWFGGFLLAIAGFTWVWAAAGGIVAILYSVLTFYMLNPGMFHPLRPEEHALPSYYLSIYGSVYGIFIIGGILNLVVGLRRKAAPYPETISDKQLRWAARITAFAPIVITAIIYTLIYPSPFVFGAIPGLITAGIAWFWPTPGGFLMLLLTIPGFYNLFESNYDFQLKLPAYILCLIFIASGFLHLIIAWRRRKMTRGETEIPTSL